MVMAPPLHLEGELEDEKDARVSYAIPKDTSEVSRILKSLSCKEQKRNGVVSPEVFADKKQVNGVTDYAVQSTDKGICSRSTAKELSARLKLNTICSTNGWKDPLYEFQEQGPPHNKMFTCKVTVLVETMTDTVVEIFSEPRSQKEAAHEHSAQGALWYLKHFGHVN